MPLHSSDMWIPLFYITVVWVLMVESSLFSLMICVITSRCKIVYCLLFFCKFMSPFSLRLLLGKPLTCVELVCQMMAFTLPDIHIRQSHHHIALCLLFPMVNICIVKLQIALPTFLTFSNITFYGLSFSTSTRTYLPVLFVSMKICLIFSIFKCVYYFINNHNCAFLNYFCLFIISSTGPSLV